MSDPHPLFHIQHVSKSFGGVHALQEVHFEIFPGEVHALLGENGAGKSTLIKIITGVYQPDAGELFFDGQPIHFANPRAAQEHGVAAIYQEPSLFPDLDIAENIMIGRQPMGRMGVDWKRMYQDAGALLKRLGMALDPRTKARELSVAQQQLVEIARALSINAKVLIMDEPTSSLTQREVDELFTIVRQLRASGTAIVFISHRLEELFALADRVTTLRDGKYVGTRAMADVTTDDLIRMMVGRSLDELFPKQAVEAGEVVLEVSGLGVAGSFADVSFQLRKGEILGMAGLIGAGRTNVARALFGTEPATSGTIKLDGKVVTIRSPDAAMALGIGYVPEDRKEHGLVLAMSIADNITLPVISTDDGDALVPVGKQAIDAGIPVVTWDSAIATGGRTVHINQAVSADIAAIQIKIASDLAKGEGSIAILSATSTAPNQNEWIGLMKEELKKPEYAKLKLVDTVYGDDQDEKSYTEAQGLFKKYPDLKVIIAPTTVGIAASARAVQDGNLVGKVFVTGLGTPNQMRGYVKSGASPAFALWNPADLGYLAIQTLNAIATGKIKGVPGDKYTAGKLGDYTIDADGTVLLGPPTEFNKDNIDKFNF